MAFLLDAQELKTGLVIFRRADVKHRNWYCRIKLPKADRYKTVCLKTADIDAARERAFDQDADLRFRIKHDVPIFNRPFSQIAKGFVDLQKERAEAGQIAPARWGARRIRRPGAAQPLCRFRTNKFDRPGPLARLSALAAKEWQGGQWPRQRRLHPLRDVDLSLDHVLCRYQEIHRRKSDV